MLLPGGGAAQPPSRSADTRTAPWPSWTGGPAGVGYGPTMKTTWKAPEGAGHGTLDAEDRKELPDSAYAFPEQRKEPLTDARHVRTALARFDQVRDVTDADRDLAFANIRQGGQALRRRGRRGRTGGSWASGRTPDNPAH